MGTARDAVIFTVSCPITDETVEDGVRVKEILPDVSVTEIRST